MKGDWLHNYRREKSGKVAEIKKTAVGKTIQPNFMKLHLLFSRLQGCCQLIGTRGGLGAAEDAFGFCNDFVYIHAFNETADALKIAVAATQETDVSHFAVYDFKVNFSGAGAFCTVSKFHDRSSK